MCPALKLLKGDFEIFIFIDFSTRSRLRISDQLMDISFVGKPYQTQKSIFIRLKMSKFRKKRVQVSDQKSETTILQQKGSSLVGTLL